ncbi:zf-HC2 domain-containing protein [Anaeromyxobacter oryzae]|uniref:Putative zinc-finger domain-containing protein n=1 Tax=Anaeromyxobacter oryzae TaxID=2918170 RepID=A0ABM7X4P9_9BACT|nr:zf-HC2 domain-containing protein [Anaeromyxobacter oryzae]BDG06782.1 hypothetical protein AMOR_57780 [Anaeromyxobacter oryzae]
MTPTLGGPGVACSITRLRRLEAGELSGEERARVAAHVEGCDRCQSSRRELAAEARALAASLPFEDFAAGVAGRLAAAERPAPRRARRLARALALAAGLVVAAAVPLVLRSVRPGPVERTKGGAELTVYVRERDGARVLAPGEPVPPGAALRVGIDPAGRRHAALALVDADGVAILYAGPAGAGVLADAFEWTGSGAGRLVLVLDDAPVDGPALARRLAAGGIGAAAPGRAAEVVVRPLARGRP